MFDDLAHHRATGKVLTALLVLAAASAATAVACAATAAEPTDGDVGDGADDAGDADDDDSSSRRTTVVARGVEEDPLDALRSVEVIDETDLRQRRPRTVPEALMGTPGVMVQKTNHAGGSPYIRGMVGPQNLILVDGVRLNASTYRTGPIQYLNTVDVFSLRGIEVLRGPGSVLYGSDAIGGVILLESRRPAAPRGEVTGDGVPSRFVPRALVQGSTADWERSGRADLSWATDGVGFIGGITLRRFADLRGGGDVGRQVWSGYDEVDWDAALVFESPSGHGLDLTYQSGRVMDAGRTDKLDSSDKLTMYDQNFRDLVYARAKIRLDPIHTRLTITPSYQRQVETRRSIQFDDDSWSDTEWVVRERDVVHSVGVSARLDTRLLARRLDLLYGAEVLHDAVRSEAGEGPDDASLIEAQPAYPAGSSYDTFGLYALVTGTPVRTARWVELVVYGGARLAATRAFAPDIEHVGDVDFRHTGGVGCAGVRLRQRGTFNVGVGWDQGYRAPNLSEAARVGSTGSWFQVPNQDLTPEGADTMEGSGRFHAGPVSLAAAGYVTFLRDFIVRDDASWQGSAEFMGLQVVQNVNAGRGRVVGAEGSLMIQLPATISVGGDVTGTRGDYDDAEEGWVPASRIPPLFGTARVRAEPPVADLFVEVYVEWAAAQDRLSPLDETDARIPEGGTPGWWTINARAGVVPTDWLALSLGAANLTDTAYKIHASGVYAPGIDLWLAAEFTPSARW